MLFANNLVYKKKKDYVKTVSLKMHFAYWIFEGGYIVHLQSLSYKSWLKLTINLDWYNMKTCTAGSCGNIQYAICIITSFI